MKSGFVPISSAIRANAALLRAAPQEIVLFSGPPGTGKSSCARQLASDDRRAVVNVRLSAQMPPRGVLHAIENSIAKEHERREPRTFHEQSPFTLFLEIRRLLERARRPTVLVVDEADYLIERLTMTRLLHTLRDLADEPDARLTLVLISIASLAEKLAAPTTGLFAAVRSRISEHVHFGDATLDDALLIAGELLEDVRLDRDLVADCLKRSDGSLRSLRRQFEEVEAIAHAAQLPKLDLATFRSLTALPAPPRRVAAAAPIVGKKAVVAA